MLSTSNNQPIKAQHHSIHNHKTNGMQQQIHNKYLVIIFQIKTITKFIFYEMANHSH